MLSPHHADTYSLTTFAQYPGWRELTGDAKVYAIYTYLVDQRTGLYPMGVPAREGTETLSEYSAVTDPVKMLNVYPIGHCGTLGPTMAGIMEGMGIGPARTLIIPGWNHVASEVHYAGRWHYLDLDVRAVFRRDDGSLASMADAQRDARLWQQPNSPLFFPLDPLDQVRDTYAQSAVAHRYGVASGGHTMDYVLRQGETFTRWWKPQGGRWNQHPSYGQKPFPRTLLEQEPRGPKSKHPSFTIHTHGNGRFVYRPNLTSQSTDFEDGVYDANHVQPGAEGLTLHGADQGYAVFEVRSPYVIVPKVGDLDTTEDDREASVVRLEAAGASLALSLDNGLTWQELGPGQGTHDLTPQVSGTYGYLLKITLSGQPDQAVLRSLEITTWIQLHPASLPALRRGRNTLRLVTGDHYGLPTRVIEVRPPVGSREECLKYLAEPPQDYDPARQTSRIRGTVTAKVHAPPHTQIAWFSAGASFATHQQTEAPKTRNTMAYAAERSEEFREFYRAEIPADQSHWHYNVDREVRLDPPARAVYVRYLGDPAVNNIRIYAHCLEDQPSLSGPVMITHAWTEGGVEKQKEVRLEKPDAYDIVTEDDPADTFIEICVPSGRRPVAQDDPAARPGLSGTKKGTPVEPWFPKAPPLPPPSGDVLRVATVDELFAAAEKVKPGDSILLADGHYWMPRCLWIRTDNVTVRGASGNRECVILDGAKSQHGELLALQACSGVTVADLTIQNVRHNGIKINSDSNVQRVTVYNCILHNIWQRAVKGVRVPPEQREKMRPMDCRVQCCLFYNDRPKQFADDPADTPQNFNGNYVGGIDVMYAKQWTICDNVFVGIQGRTRGARGAVFLWHETENCTVERNIIIDCDTGIALGNSHRPPDVPVHCTRCIVRNNFITRAPESGIVADYTKDCQILHNTIHDPSNRLGRLIRLVHDNDGLLVANNLLSGPDVRNESPSPITFQGNLANDMTIHFADPDSGNLHWKSAPPEVVDQAAPNPGAMEDIDGQPRGPTPDIGADEFDNGPKKDL